MIAKDPVDCAHERDAWRCRIAPDASLAQLPPPPLGGLPGLPGGAPPGLAGGGLAGLPRLGGPGPRAAGFPRFSGIGAGRASLHGGQVDIIDRSGTHVYGHGEFSMATPATMAMAMAAQAIATAIDRGDAATGRVMANMMSPAILTPAAAITPTSTAPS